jgi:hypothetical protein
MSAVVHDPLIAGREAFCAQQWERAYELLSAADAARTLPPEAAHQGREIKHEGDGFFTVFPDPRSALECAIEMQRTLDEHRREHGFAPRVRIGVHASEATLRGGDFFGRASTWQPAWRRQPLLGRFSPVQRRSRPRAMASAHLSRIDLTSRDSPRR